jgi:hypothetical protein
MTKPSPLRAALCDMARRPAGFASSEIVHGFTKDQVQQTASRMADAGVLHRAKLSYRSVRYFDTAERAKDCEERASRYADAKAAPAVTVHRAPGRAPWDQDAPIHFPTNADGSPAYRITRGPSPPERVFRTNTHAL